MAKVYKKSWIPLNKLVKGDRFRATTLLTSSKGLLIVGRDFKRKSMFEVLGITLKRTKVSSITAKYLNKGKYHVVEIPMSINYLDLHVQKLTLISKVTTDQKELAN